MTEQWRRVRAHWATHGVGTTPPPSVAELDAFEYGHGVVLPGDLRAFYTELGGTDCTSVRSHSPDGFAIWPLSEVRPAAPGLFVIADYLHLSWTYAIALDQTADGPHPVTILDVAEPKPVAASFTEFIDLYLVDSAKLYPD